MTSTPETPSTHSAPEPPRSAPDVDGVSDEDVTGWRRMHPVTPALKGWKVLVAVLAIGWFQVGENIEQAIDLLHGPAFLALIGGILLIGLIGFGYSAIAWRVTRFAVTDEAVHLRTGILFRQQRQARLDRLQAVDVVQPLLARLVGLAELKLEVAGGSGSAVSLAFLREADAEALRAELLALSAGLQRPGSVPVAPPADGAEADAPAPVAPVPFEVAPERQVYELPMGRLVRATLRSGAVPVLLLVAAGAITLAVVSRDISAAFVLVAPLFAGVTFVWSRINQGANFRAAISPDGIRLRHGLTEARAQTVPPGRVQAIRLRQGPLWRGPDWWRVEINVAGYGQGDQQQRDTVLHPVATRDEAMTALWLVLPDLGVQDPTELVTAALTGRDDDGGFTPAPRRARWVDPVGWRRHGVRVTERALVTRSGRIWRSVDVVPHERTQSLGLEQGPIQRRLGLASFVLHSTPGPVSPRVNHLDAAVAAELLDEQAERARNARATATPEQWMRAVGAPTPAVPNPVPTTAPAGEVPGAGSTVPTGPTTAPAGEVPGAGSTGSPVPPAAGADG
ncbi:PH domain-containing protein [Cellulomonas xylanilytica]|uniref:Membrane protein n=1 Tax=Cellulomonas xylanilytica TaxID=233583 RepID=A0A510V982_9CELL|nr:PH domain-containing protein [Cellulomonas xylanilytica]GEK22531.1 membrane protein [Cellulomonas xylanilytica]